MGKEVGDAGPGRRSPEGEPRARGGASRLREGWNDRVRGGRELRRVAPAPPFAGVRQARSDPRRGRRTVSLSQRSSAQHAGWQDRHKISPRASTRERLDCSGQTLMAIARPAAVATGFIGAAAWIDCSGLGAQSWPQPRVRMGRGWGTPERMIGNRRQKPGRARQGEADGSAGSAPGGMIPRG